MLTMATDETRHYVQTLKRLKTRYTSWAARMRATDRYAERSGHTSNDAIGNALLMWANEQDPEALAGMLEPYLNQFQKMWIEKDKALNGEGGPTIVNETKVLGKEARKRKQG